MSELTVSVILMSLQVKGFSSEAVATFIAVVGVLSVAAQTAVLGSLLFFHRIRCFFFVTPFFQLFVIQPGDGCLSCSNECAIIIYFGLFLLSSHGGIHSGLLMRTVGPKATILIGLVFEMLQLAWYGFGSQTW